MMMAEDCGIRCLAVTADILDEDQEAERILANLLSYCEPLA